jgi:hypothetical protein
MRAQRAARAASGLVGGWGWALEPRVIGADSGVERLPPPAPSTIVRWVAASRASPTRSDSPGSSIATPSGHQVALHAGKRVNGRKRHIVVDTLGLLLVVAVTTASV